MGCDMCQDISNLKPHVITPLLKLHPKLGKDVRTANIDPFKTLTV